MSVAKHGAVQILTHYPGLVLPPRFAGANSVHLSGTEEPAVAPPRTTATTAANTACWSVSCPSPRCTWPKETCAHLTYHCKTRNANCSVTWVLCSWCEMYQCERWLVVSRATHAPPRPAAAPLCWRWLVSLPSPPPNAFLQIHVHGP